MNQTDFLIDTIDYYSVDPVKRRCVGTHACRYSPISVGKVGLSEGCAIGRHLTPELQEQLDGFPSTGVGNDPIFKKLPQNLQELGQEFLRDVQTFHDFEEHWNTIGLTPIGKEYLKRLIKQFSLSKEKFTKYL